MRACCVPSSSTSSRSRSPTPLRHICHTCWENVRRRACAPHCRAARAYHVGNFAWQSLPSSKAWVWAGSMRNALVISGVAHAILWGLNAWHAPKPLAGDMAAPIAVEIVSADEIEKRAEPEKTDTPQLEKIEQAGLPQKSDKPDAPERSAQAQPSPARQSAAPHSPARPAQAPQSSAPAEPTAAAPTPHVAQAD